MNTYEINAAVNQQEPCKIPCEKCEGWIRCSACEWGELVPGKGFWCNRFGGFDEGCSKGDPK